MARHCVFAWTQELGYKNYPAYVSFNYDSDLGYVVLTVRGPESANGDCGATVDVPLVSKVLYNMARILFGYACTGNA